MVVGRTPHGRDAIRHMNQRTAILFGWLAGAVVWLLCFTYAPLHVARPPADAHPGGQTTSLLLRSTALPALG